DGDLETTAGSNAAMGLYFRVSLGEKSQLMYVQEELYDFASGLGPSGAVGHISHDSVHINPQSVRAINNYIRIFWSAILTDLGAQSTSNVLTDSGLLRSAVPTLSPNHHVPSNDPYMFKIPLDPVQPTQLNARYLCHKPAPPALSEMFVVGLMLGCLFIGLLYITVIFVVVWKKAIRALPELKLEEAK
ncbi:hypothetical protein BDV93DRAFT_517008, partial [Ceratobasidium sp. AG-I]